MKKILNLRNAACLLIIFGMLGVLLIPSSIFAAGGQKILTTVHCKSLEGNPTGVSANRKVLTYLPPGYAENPNTRYPVIYLLHRWGANYEFFSGRGEIYPWYEIKIIVNIPQLCDSLIAQGAIKPMIAVMPDSHDELTQGRLYVNSTGTGNWEDFIAKDIVAFADSAYRTIPQAASRGILGDFTGAAGAFNLAMKHPQIFGVVYGMRGMLDFRWLFLDSNWIGGWKAGIMWAAEYSHIDNPFVQFVIACAYDYSPNPTAKPYKCDYPVDSSGNIVDAVWQKWLLYDPLTMIDQYKGNLLQLKGIGFGMSNADWKLTANNLFADKLKLSNIPYVYHVYDTRILGENLGYSESMAKNTLPFFSEKLAFSTVTSVSGDAEVPDTFALFQNSPNPFNPSTTISFTLTKAGKTTVDVFNVSGQKIDTILNASLSAGSHSVTWDASRFSAGVYFYTIQSGKFLGTRKMTLLK